jgi:parallel beta-helix repeat protein
MNRLISGWSSVTIVNNTFTSNGITGIYLRLPTTATVANNIITKNGNFGIRADRSPSLLVMQNTITSNFLGVQVSGNSRARVLNNVFDGNGVGAVSLQSALDVVNNTFVRH